MTRRARRIIDERGKARLDLLLMPCLDEIAAVFESGNRKPGRGEFNWREARVRKSNMIAGALRHIRKDAAGERRDPESKRRHLAHAVARLLIALDAEDHGCLIAPKSRNKEGRT